MDTFELSAWVLRVVCFWCQQTARQNNQSDPRDDRGQVSEKTLSSVVPPCADTPFVSTYGVSYRNTPVVANRDV